MCRALLYYLAQTWTADLHRQAQRDKPDRPRASPGVPAVRAASGGLAACGTLDGGCRATSCVIARD